MYQLIPRKPLSLSKILMSAMPSTRARSTLLTRHRVAPKRLDGTRHDADLST
jgi:hypothetical protein